MVMQAFMFCVGVLHGDEIEYIFGTFVRGHSQEEKKLSKLMQTSWANFAKTG
jgi:carboxylesterase type B